MSLIKCASLLVIVLSVLTANPQLSRHVIALHGNTTFGYYYANIFVGSPPQEQSVIIDTGSGILALPCSKCLSCGKEHIQPPFDITRSKSNKIMTCVRIVANRNKSMSCVRPVAKTRKMPILVRF